MEETQMPDDEQLQKIMEQLQSQFDPRKFMTPSQREIAELSDDELSAEYLLVQAKSLTLAIHGFSIIYKNN